MAPIELPVAPPAFGSYGRSTGLRLRGGRAKFRFPNGSNTWTPGIFARCGDGTCDCCPYGYHIDLDFVRFCESLKDSGNYQSYLEHLQQLKRGKRQQRKALQEVMDSSEILFTSSGKKARPPIPYSWLCERPPSAGADQPDSLNAVYKDFEETLHSSRAPPGQRLPPDGGDLQSVQIPEDRRHVYTKEEQQKAEQLLDMIFGDYQDFDEEDGFRSGCPWSDSVSSTGSIETISSLNYPSSNSVASRQLEKTLASLSTSGSDSCSPYRISIDPNALSKIRNQLAACLEKMRDLELQVNDVPVLQVKLSILKEEKRLLKLQLKAKNRAFGSEAPSRSSLLDSSSAGESQHEVEMPHQPRLPPPVQIQTLTPPREPPRVPPIHSEGALPLRASPPTRAKRSLDEEPPSSASLKDQLWDEAAAQPRYKSNAGSAQDVASYLKESSVNEPLVVPTHRYHTGGDCCVGTRDRATHTDRVQTRHAGVGASSPLPPPVREEAAKKQLCDGCNEDLSKAKRPLPRSSATQTTPEKPKDCADCAERRKRSLRTTSVNTDAGEPPRKTPKETLDLNASPSKACEQCKQRKSIRTYSVGSSTVAPRTRDQSTDPIAEPKPSSIRIRSPPPKVKNFTRSVGVQSACALTTSQGVQVRPNRVRTRDISCQSDSRVTLRHVGTQIERLRTNSNSVASGDLDVRHALCDSCSNKRLCSVGTGDIAIYDECCNRCGVKNKREGAVQCEILSESDARTVQETRGKSDKYVLTDDSYCEDVTELIAIPCERCDVERRDFGLGDEDVFVDKQTLKKAVEHVGVMTDHSIIEPLSFPPQAAGNLTGMALSRTSSASSVSHVTGSVRLCDKCNCAIESVAKDFIDKNELDPTIASLQSRIPKLNQRGPRAPPRRAKPAAFESVTKTLRTQASLDEKPIMLGQRIPEPAARTGGNGTSEGFESDYMSDSSSESEDDFVSVGRIICHFPTPADAGTALLSVDPTGSLVVCRSSSGCSGSGSSVGNNESFSYMPPGLTRSWETAHDKHTLSRDMEIACGTLNEYLQRPENSDPNKLKAALQTIQTEWFKVASRVDTDPYQIQDYLEEFDKMSNHLLHRIVNMADNNGNTALHYAVSHGNFPIVSRLLDSKVTDVNKQNKAGYTPVMLVALADVDNDSQKETAKRLFATGDVNSKASQNGQTALMLAASHGKGEMIKMLLEADADPNIQDNDGSTALMCAAEHGYIDVVRVLLANPDVEINIADNDGQTALSIAMEAGNKDTALLIYASSHFSRGNSPYSSLHRRTSRISPRATPPPSRPSRTPPPSRPSRTPPPSRTSRTPPPPSPSRSRKGSTSSVSSFSRAWF